MYSYSCHANRSGRCSSRGRPCLLSMFQFFPLSFLSPLRSQATSLDKPCHCEKKAIALSSVYRVFFKSSLRETSQESTTPKTYPLPMTSPFITRDPDIPLVHPSFSLSRIKIHICIQPLFPLFQLLGLFLFFFLVPFDHFRSQLFSQERSIVGVKCWDLVGMYLCRKRVSWAGEGEAINHCFSGKPKKTKGVTHSG